MGHEVVEAAEALLDKEFKVLDKGFVRLVDYLGSDHRIVQAARVSYGQGTKSYREDKGLIDYLLRNEHTSPFEQVVLTFHCKMPIFVARQWVRHRTARLNEISGRYSVMNDEFYVPALEDVSLQSQDNKQGRSEEGMDPAEAARVREALVEGQKAAYEAYQGFIDQGLARELARINLPLSAYTEWYWQIDLHNLFHFLRLRMDGHAQKEIRVYAEAMYDIVKAVCPLAVESFDQHLRRGLRFSGQEMEAMRSWLGDQVAQDEMPDELKEVCTKAGMSARDTERFWYKLHQGRQI